MDIISLFKEIAEQTGKPIEVIIVGAQALPYYGVELRTTMDIDAEVVKGDLEEIYLELKKRGFESDLSENVSRWSVISLPEGYRDRTITIYQDEKLKISVLNPYDFIIMKLRRGTEQDIEDCLSVALANNLSMEELDKYFENAISTSIKDTALFNFKLIYKHFRQILSEKLIERNQGPEKRL
ncbi:DUF6036 family nucleotidyltransferase [Hydrogenobacter hydrogenophilus]|uniref:DUF6036 domain-containing protein n=1 Tax=Hydrogenobacter hydrogenophilus TaxID=35835 RepID=A0A285P1C7_9AQUI|nr:DUF6036 family nucleotidyltransferase [Hydrogenobacter hydrogenophilus]SNZ15532.1 hypothetical protein SAMN06265353_1394 [Hydrogenobacter hydrogenophilus]